MTLRTLPPPLLALTPGDLTPGAVRPEEGLLAAVRAAVGAGLRGVLLREARLGDRATLALARRIDAVLAGVGGWLGVHDRAHVARAVGARGTHLGFRSLAPADARRAVGELAIGLSTHAWDAAPPPAAVDYVFFGPVRDTSSKRGRAGPVGFDGLAARCAAGGAPVWAIGGVRPVDVRPAREAGARGVAVLGGVLADADPAGATRAYLEELAACP